MENVIKLRLNFPKIVLPYHGGVSAGFTTSEVLLRCTELPSGILHFEIGKERNYTINGSKIFRWVGAGAGAYVNGGVNNNNNNYNPFVVPEMLGRNTIKVLFCPLVS